MGATALQAAVEVRTRRLSRVRATPAAFAVERLRFRRAPLAAAVVWLGFGIGLERSAYQPAVVLAAALVLLGGLVGAALGWARRVAWVPVAGVWIVLGMAAAEWRTSPGLGTVNAYADGLQREVRGRVVRVRTLPARVAGPEVDRVEAWEAAEETVEDSGGALSVDVAVERLERVTPDWAELVPASGIVRLTLYAGKGALPALECGQEVAGALRLWGLDRFNDPGAWQYADYLAGQGISVRASAAAAALRVIGREPPGWRCRLQAAQAWASARLLGYVESGVNRGLPGAARLNLVDARMLAAMLFGDRMGLDQALRTGFERTGTFHLFVVSGLHIALLAGGILWGLRRMRVPEWAATLVTIAAAAGYAALTGLGQPAQRSLGMVSVFLVARLLSRGRDSLQALGAAGVAMLVWDPASAFEAGFQMTALAVVAIAGIGRPLAERWFLSYGRAAGEVFRARRMRLDARLGQLRLTLEMLGEGLAEVWGWTWLRNAPGWTVRGVVWTAELALLGIVTELVMALPMAMYFHRAALFALPANMVVLPVIAVLAPAAVGTFVGSLVSPWVAVAPGAATALLLHGVTGVIGRISGLAAADWRVCGPSWEVGGGVLVVLGGVCWAVRRHKRWALVGAAVLPGVALAVLWPRGVDRRVGVLEVTALDVGQGDAVVVVGPGGRVMLVDAGGPVGRGASEVVAGFDVGEEVVAPYLWSRGVSRLDVVVLTHAHTDHMGGMPAVLRDLRPRELWVGPAQPRSGLYRALLAEADQLGITVRRLAAEDALRWDGMDVYGLSPAVGYGNPGAPRNDDSLVLRMQYGQSSVLLEGDAERASEAGMVARGLGAVTLLKVGHHGSNTSSTEGFLAAARPVDAVVSDGRRNSFGHPKAETIARIAAKGTHLFRVDELGATTFYLSADGKIREKTGLGELPAHGLPSPH